MHLPSHFFIASHNINCFWVCFLCVCAWCLPVSVWENRWYSMPMAAITTNVGGSIIKDAHILCSRIGVPIELDTDGIWTCLPSGFPNEIPIKMTNDKTLVMEYPCSMLNLRTYRKYKNDFYHVLWFYIFTFNFTFLF